MRFDLTQQRLQEILQQRNFGYLVAAAMVITNLLLVLKIYTADERWLLIPQFDTDHIIEVRSSDYSDKYLMDWADGITRHLLTVNPDSAERKIEDVLRIAASGYGNLKEKLTKDAKRIRRDQIATVFYPKNFEIKRSEQTVKVTGEFQSYFGRDRQPVSLEKSFILSWKIGNRGFLFLEDFKEVQHD
jgi:type IV conjugative transfer system protein TraE